MSHDPLPLIPGAGRMPGGDEYTLVVQGSDSGFFSNVNRVVNHLAHALGHDGCRAVRVVWRIGEGWRECPYGRPEDGNLWDVFFEPLDFPARPSSERVATLYADSGMTSGLAYGMYKRATAWRRFYGRAFRDHVRVREHITDRVDAIWNDRLSGASCVGVHVRHPDHDIENPRPSPPISAFVRSARRLTPTGRPVRVFLATDVTEAVEQFSAAFGDLVVVQPDVVRSTMSASHVHHDQPKSGTGLGEQVLTDAILLSRCDALVHTTSNIATAVGYMNPELEMVYCEPTSARVAAAIRYRRPRFGQSQGP